MCTATGSHNSPYVRHKRCCRETWRSSQIIRRISRKDASISSSSRLQQSWMRRHSLLCQSTLPKLKRKIQSWELKLWTNEATRLFSYFMSPVEGSRRELVLRRCRVDVDVIQVDVSSGGRCSAAVCCARLLVHIFRTVPLGTYHCARRRHTPA